MTKALNIREYWDIVGTDTIDKIIDQVGSSKAVFRQMRYGLKRCSPDRADAIIEAAATFSPGFAPSRKRLIDGAPMAGHQAKILPSAAFLASRKSVRSKAGPKAIMKARKGGAVNPEEIVMASPRALKARARLEPRKPAKVTPPTAAKPAKPKKVKTMTQETTAKPLEANLAPTPQTATDRAMVTRSRGPAARSELQTKAVTMRAAGMKSAAIAAALGLHRATVDRLIAAAKPIIKSTGHHHDPDA